MKDRAIYIAAALESIELIQEYTDGYTQNEFLADRKTQDAVIRNLEIIGQALKDYGINELSQQRPEISWHQISGMRNILAHEYLGVDLIMVWERKLSSNLRPVVKKIKL
ncbi:DUF86 domain-containing protein [Ectothiorhodospiraceae bacterium BW-2]|nr:DUF86 domain-containing protein [Ectothiorhodospiraceae bacterium BW-2]